MNDENNILELDGLGIRYGRRTLFEDVSLSVRRGERLFILGPSGCGKTTLLRIIAGLITRHTGRIWIDGRSVAGEGTLVPPHRRGVGFVFQDGALWPHLSVEQHLYYSRQARENLAWTEKILELTGLAHRRHDFPHRLSGGERQRIALARALTGQPRLLLLDEPLRNLDRNLARKMRSKIIAILEELKISAVFVTHDQEEALSMAHRILIMSTDGPVQLGSSEDLYTHPVSAWVARFFGEANAFQGRSDSEGRVSTPFGAVNTGLEPGTWCELLFRPGQLEIVSAGSRDDDAGPAIVRRTTFLGETSEVILDLNGVTCVTHCQEKAPRVGDEVGLRAVSPPLVFACDANPNEALRNTAVVKVEASRDD